MYTKWIIQNIVGIGIGIGIGCGVNVEFD